MIKNAAFLSKLGIPTLPDEKTSSLERPAKTKIRKRKQIESFTDRKFVRRSVRIQAKEHPSQSIESNSMDSSHVMVPKDEPPELTEADYEDSAVLKYICNMKERETKSSLDEACPDGQLIGFQMVSDTPSFIDRKIKRIYSMSFHPEHAVFAAGGHGGHVSIFGSASGETNSMLSFRAHGGWISAVDFSLSRGSKNRNILTTASNDGCLKLWDIDHQSTSSMPKRVGLNESLHSSGIYSMSIHDQNILTASKDTNVHWSRVREDGDVCSVANYEGHTEVVKCVRWHPQGQRFISCGNDLTARLTDTRAPGTNVTVLRPPGARYLNSVTWNAHEPHMIAVAGYSPVLHIYDVRKPEMHLFAFTGHTRAETLKNKIYHPVFVHHGQALVTTGSASTCLSLYCTQTGQTISRGELGFEPTSILETPDDSKLMITAGSSIYESSYRISGGRN